MRRRHTAAAIAFVSAWVVGLILAASGPAPDDSARTIAGYFASHEAKSMVAQLLIDGVAGLAIMAIALSLGRYLPGERRLRRLIVGSGIAAGVASIGQMVVGETLSYRAADGASLDSTRRLFTGLNDGDTVKIALLATMIGAASMLGGQSGAFPRWLATAGLVFAPLLALSGLAFPLDSSALYASLELTLLGLLGWVVATAIVLARRVGTAERATPAPTLSRAGR